MQRFRQLLILSSIWIMTILGVERFFEQVDNPILYITYINIDAFVYIGLFLIVVLLLLYSDFAKHSGWVYAGVMIGYTILKIMIEAPIDEMDIPSIIVEVVLLLLTIGIFKRVSLALVNFEQVVENVIIKPNNLNVLDEFEGIEHVDTELFRARRFERNVTFLRLLTRQIVQESGHFDMSESIQQRYYQYQIASIVRSLTYKSDLLLWNGDDLIVCLPETNEQEGRDLAARIYRQIKIRLNMKLPIGAATFPENGLIYDQLVAYAGENVAINLDGKDTQEIHALTLDDLDETNLADLPVEPPTRNYVPAQNVAPATTQKEGIVHQFNTALHEIFNPLPSFDLRAGVLSIRQNDLSDPNFWVYDIPTQSTAAKDTYQFIKRIIDITLVVMSLPVILPLFAIIAAIIYMTDRGSIFFRQERTGLGGERFKMFKFRTMVVDAEEKLKDLAAQGLAKLDENGKLAEPLKLKHDPRVTKIGRILRKTSLDELPQLFNVLIGNMSIVGPRPTSWDVNSYTLMQTERLSIRPGITGLWQVCARGDVDFNDWVEWDMAYIDRVCLYLDLRIIFETVAQVAKGKGAR